MGLGVSMAMWIIATILAMAIMDRCRVAEKVRSITFTQMRLAMEPGISATLRILAAANAAPDSRAVDVPAAVVDMPVAADVARRFPLM